MRQGKRLIGHSFRVFKTWGDKSLEIEKLSIGICINHLSRSTKWRAFGSCGTLRSSRSSRWRPESRASGGAWRTSWAWERRYRYVLIDPHVATILYNVTDFHYCRCGVRACQCFEFSAMARTPILYTLPGRSKAQLQSLSFILHVTFIRERTLSANM